MWAGSELRGERGATGEQRVQAPLASADAGRGCFSTEMSTVRRSPPKTRPPRWPVQHGGPLRTGKRDLIRPAKTPLASSAGNKMASRILPLPGSGSCTRGWRRRARSRRNYFLFSDPEREVDCLTSRVRACVRTRLRPGVAPDYILQPWSDSWKKQTII